MEKYKDRCYDAAELDKIQMVLAEILKAVLSVCNRHSFTVFADSGTALGAVRHKGFIPWDDDIDIGLPRKDYDELMRILPEELDERFGVDNWLTNKDFPAPNACVFAKGTLCVPVEMKNCKYQYGISIGVYPYDNVPDNERKAKRQALCAWFFTRLHWLKVLPKPYLSQTGWVRILIYAVCTVVHLFLMVIPKKALVNVCEYYYRQYNAEDTLKLNNFSNNELKASQVARSEVFPLIDGKFEDIDIKIMHDYDTALRRMYHGDYMQLPPPEKRKNHFPCRLEFGNWK